MNLFILDLTEIDGTAQVKAFRLLLPCYDLNNVGLLVFVFCIICLICTFLLYLFVYFD